MLYIIPKPSPSNQKQSKTDKDNQQQTITTIIINHNNQPKTSSASPPEPKSTQFRLVGMSGMYHTERSSEFEVLYVRTAQPRECRCTLRNPVSATRCEACDNPRPGHEKDTNSKSTSTMITNTMSHIITTRRTFKQS